MTEARLKKVVSTFMQCLSCGECIFVNTCNVLQQETNHSLCHHLYQQDDIDTGDL